MTPLWILPSFLVFLLVIVLPFFSRSDYRFVLRMLIAGSVCLMPLIFVLTMARNAGEFIEYLLFAVCLPFVIFLNLLVHMGLLAFAPFVLVGMWVMVRRARSAVPRHRQVAKVEL